MCPILSSVARRVRFSEPVLTLQFSFLLQNKKDRCGEIKLRQASEIQKVDYKGKKHCFQIVTPERTYHVCAESADEMNLWINAIKAQQQALKGGPAAKAAGAASSTPSEAGTAYSSLPAAPGSTAAPVNPGAGQTAPAPAGPSNTDAVRCFVGATYFLAKLSRFWIRCFRRSR